MRATPPLTAKYLTHGPTKREEISKPVLAIQRPQDVLPKNRAERGRQFNCHLAQARYYAFPSTYVASIVSGVSPGAISTCIRRTNIWYKKIPPRAMIGPEGTGVKACKRKGTSCMWTFLPMNSEFRKWTRTSKVIWTSYPTVTMLRKLGFSPNGAWNIVKDPEAWTRRVFGITNPNYLASSSSVFSSLPSSSPSLQIYGNNDSSAGSDYPVNQMPILPSSNSTTPSRRSSSIGSYYSVNHMPILPSERGSSSGGSYYSVDMPIIPSNHSTKSKSSRSPSTLRGYVPSSSGSTSSRRSSSRSSSRNGTSGQVSLGSAGDGWLAPTGRISSGSRPSSSVTISSVRSSPGTLVIYNPLRTGSGSGRGRGSGSGSASGSGSKNPKKRVIHTPMGAPTYLGQERMGRTKKFKFRAVMRRVRGNDSRMKLAWQRIVPV